MAGQSASRHKRLLLSVNGTGWRKYRSGDMKKIQTAKQKSRQAQENTYAHAAEVHFAQQKK